MTIFLLLTAIFLFTAPFLVNAGALRKDGKSTITEKHEKKIRKTLRNNPLLGTIPQPPAAFNEYSGTCPDGSHALKHCTAQGCPTGYYCHYDLCCQHLKPGSCPWKMPNGVNPAGPPCDSDIDCAYNLKCCMINGRSRCIFPYGYSGGTVGISPPSNPMPAMGPPVIGPPIMGPPIIAPQYGYMDPMYGMGDPFMGGYGMPMGGFGDYDGYGWG